MKHTELLPRIKELVDDAIDRVFTDIHQEYDRTESGDISPEQHIELRNLQDSLSKLILAQLIQNVPSPKFEGFDVYHVCHPEARYYASDHIDAENHDSDIDWILVSIKEDEAYGRIWIALHANGKFSTVYESSSEYGTLEDCKKLLNL